MSGATFLRVNGCTAAERALRAAGSADWLILGLAAPALPAHTPVAANEPCSEGEINRLASFADLLAGPVAVVCVLEPGLSPRAWQAIAEPVEAAVGPGHRLTLLVRWGEPPSVTGRSDGCIYSFVCPAALLRSLRDRVAEMKSLSYAVLEGLFAGTVPGVQVGVRQLGAPLPNLSPAQGESSTAVLLPHRGPVGYLRAALRFLTATNPAPTAIRVGLDVENVADYHEVIKEYPAVEFWDCTPGPVGPYVIRQWLADRAPEESFAFHDSDDLSCYDRFHWLQAEMARTGCDMIGSYEVRFDELTREVRASRFPLDVSAALRSAPAHSQLFPTSMVRRAAFQKAGGLSTDRFFANDYQFLLRAHFHLTIRNIDQFLYVRRGRKGSLTTAPETGMSNPLRQQLLLDWRRDFEAVKAGELRLEESSLAVTAGGIHCRFRRIPHESVSDETWLLCSNVGPLSDR